LEINRGEEGKMKRILLGLVILIGLWGTVSQAAVILDILGPTTCIRGTGSPITKTFQFSSDLGGPAIVKLTNGSLEDSSIEMVSSSIIKLNSQIIFGPSEFNQNVRTLEKQILLNKGPNALEVELRGKPGGQITVQIIQPITSLKVVPSSVAVGEPGSNLQMKVIGSLSNGTEVEITNPSFGTTYSSADASIATVTSGGIVTAVALGRTTITVTNDDFLADVPVAVKGTPPAISNLLISQTLLPVPREYEKFITSVTFDFSDPNIDAQTYNFSLTGPSSIILNSSGPVFSDQPTGTGLRKFVIDSSFEEGSYQVGVEIFDSMGNSSGIQTLSFAIDSGAERFFEISGIEPSSGRPGGTIVITGRGFEADPLANEVTFERALRRAEVLSVSETRLEVVVPEGARTGTIGLMTSLGRTDSPEAFTIVPTISLSPTSMQLVTGGSTDFSCTSSGTDTYQITWSVNGQSAPDPSLGTIDNLGHFVAPSSLPSANPLTLRCASADVPTVYAEASIEIVAPVLKPGQDLVQAAVGGDDKYPTWFDGLRYGHFCSSSQP
jgi:hypothetical protein